MREFWVLYIVLYSSFFYREVVFKMFSNKEFLDQIIVVILGFSSDFIVFGVFQDKDFFFVFVDFNMFDMLVFVYLVFVNVIVLVLYLVVGSVLMLGIDFFFWSMFFSLYWDMLGGFLFEGFLDDEDDFYLNIRFIFFSSIFSFCLVFLGYSGVVGFWFIIQSELVIVLVLVSILESSFYILIFGIQGYFLGILLMFFGVQLGMFIINDFFS